MDTYNRYLYPYYTLTSLCTWITASLLVPGSCRANDKKGEQYRVDWEEYTLKLENQWNETCF